MKWILWGVLFLIGFQSQAQKTKWVHLGPFEQTIPNNSGGSPHGIGKAMCVAHHSKRRFYVGGNTSGLWMTRNKGKSWKFRLNYDRITGVQDIEVHPKRKRTLFLATGYHTSFSKQYGVGILKSTNGGRTWDTTGLHFTPSEYHQEFMTSVKVHPRQTNTLFACSKEKLYVSNDLGESWEKVLEVKEADFRDIEINPFGDQEIHVLGRKWYMSNDLGKSWTDKTGSLSKQGFGKAFGRIAMAFSKDQKGLMALAFKSRRHTKIGVSVDNGLSYLYFGREVGNGTMIDAPNMSLQFINDSKDLAVAGIRIGKVNLLTRRFSQIGSRTPGIDFIHDDIRELSYYKQELYAANDGGIAKWDMPNKSWIHLTGKGLGLTQFYGLTNHEQKPYFIAGGTQDMAAQILNNGTWHNCTDLYGDIGKMLHHTDSMAWMWAVRNSRVFFSKDTGLNWRYDHPGGRGRYDAPLLQHGKDLYFANKYVWVKRNSKGRWINLSGSLRDNKEIRAFAVSQNGALMCFAREEPTYDLSNLKNKFFMSRDSGRSWNDYTSNLPILAWRQVTDIAINAQNPQELWVSLGNFDAETGDKHKVYQSKDGGLSWNNISYNLPNYPTNCLFYLDDYILLGTDVGLFYKHDTSAVWNRYGEGLPEVCISEIVYNKKVNRLRVATFAIGIWEVEWKK